MYHHFFLVIDSYVQFRHLFENHSIGPVGVNLKFLKVSIKRIHMEYDKRNIEKTNISNQYASCSISFTASKFFLFLCCYTFPCCSIFECKFTKDFTKLSDFCFLNYTPRITKPKKKSLKTIYHTTMYHFQ
jgi:hypothetical protein